MNLIKLKKTTLSELKGRLSNGKNVLIILNEDYKGLNYNLEINLFRGDLIKNSFSGEKYDRETYLLMIEKYDSRYASSDTKCIIDKKLKFRTVEEVIDYLDKNKILKKTDWIK